MRTVLLALAALAWAPGAWPSEGARFLPELLGPEGVRAPREVYVRGVPAPAGEVSLVYYFAWEDEAHPWGVLDRAYRLFRRWYYGSPLDLEYVWVRADARTGKVLGLAFEAPRVRGPFVRHQAVSLTEGQVILTESGRPRLWVASWNHLFEAQPPPGPTSRPLPPPPLLDMDPARWAALRMDRRSQPPIESLDSLKR